MRSPSRSKVSGQEPQPYLWDYDGSWVPELQITQSRTFSVGIFQWVPRENGRGLKRSAAVQRIHGATEFPSEVYTRAQAECNRRNQERIGYPSESSG